MTVPVFTESPALDDGLVDTRNWGDEAWVHEQFAWLREHEPVRRMEPNGFEPFWALSRHADIKTVESDQRLFINDPRPILGPRMLDALVQQLMGRRHLVRSLVQMDDPDHARYRALTQQWFRGENLRRLSGRIDELAARYVDRLGELGGECDFLKDIAMWYPLRVIMSILGVPESDEPLMLKLTQEMFGSSDPDVRRSFEPASLVDVVRDFEDYFSDLSRQRRERPTDDVASVIANARLDGDRLPEHESNSYYMIIATAGHDTTSSATAGGVLAFIENPGQMDRFRADPDAHMQSALHEIIRWVSPVRQFARTADGGLHGRGRGRRGGRVLRPLVPVGEPGRGRLRRTVRVPHRPAHEPPRVRVRRPRVPRPAPGAHGDGGVLQGVVPAGRRLRAERRTALHAVHVRGRTEEPADPLPHEVGGSRAWPAWPAGVLDLPRASSKNMRRPGSGALQ